MTQDEKDILLKDLCARLPYGVKIDIPDLFISTKNNVEVLNEIFCGDDGEFRCNDSGMLIRYVKPYLFPLSSMTDEQRCEYHNNCDVGLTECGNELYYDCAESLDWLNAHYFDYRGLIEKGLAIDATELNIY